TRGLYGLWYTRAATTIRASQGTSEIRKLNFMTAHGSIRAITRLARRGCPLERADLTVADRAGLAGFGGLAALVAEDPRENRAAPPCFPLRRAALMPPTLAAPAPSALPPPVSVG